MELRQLEHFVTVADERHFTRAAELLQISQSGLSASIRALETELGISLFVRSTRRVELTAAGQALLADSIRTLASAAAAQNAVAAVRGVVRGRLTVGAEPCIGAIDLPAELGRFRIANPRCVCATTARSNSSKALRAGSGMWPWSWRPVQPRRACGYGE